MHWVWGKVRKLLERYTLLKTQDCWLRTFHLIPIKNDPSSLLDDLASDIIKGVGGVSKSNCNLAGEPVHKRSAYKKIRSVPRVNRRSCFIKNAGDICVTCQHIHNRGDSQLVDKMSNVFF